MRRCFEQVSEGSPGACKGLTRMNIRNFVVGKGGNYSVAEKVEKYTQVDATSRRK